MLVNHCLSEMNDHQGQMITKKCSVLISTKRSPKYNLTDNHCGASSSVHVGSCATLDYRSTANTNTQTQRICDR